MGSLITIPLRVGLTAREIEGAAVVVAVFTKLVGSIVIVETSSSALEDKEDSSVSLITLP